MTGWIILAVWVLGALGTFRPLTRAVIKDFAGFCLDWEDIVLGALIGGSISALCWPFVLAFWGARALAHDDAEKFARVLLGESRTDKIQRLEKEKRDHEEYIRRLERELGVSS